MIRTEKEWLELWCPLTRTIATGIVQIQGPNGVQGNVPISATVNRTESTIKDKHGIPLQCKCIGRACSGWEETKPAPKVDEIGVLIPQTIKDLEAEGICRWQEGDTTLVIDTLTGVKPKPPFEGR